MARSGISVAIAVSLLVVNGECGGAAVSAGDSLNTFSHVNFTGGSTRAVVQLRWLQTEEEDRDGPPPASGETLDDDEDALHPAEYYESLGFPPPERSSVEFTPAPEHVLDALPSPASLLALHANGSLPKQGGRGLREVSTDDFLPYVAWFEDTCYL